MIGLLDIDSKIPNLALMKISSYYKMLGEEVRFVDDISNIESYEKVFASAIFVRSKEYCEQLKERYGDRIDIGGTGYDLRKVLDDKIERMRPDYDLYTPEIVAKRLKGVMTREARLRKATEIVNAGMGFTSRGCIRECPFCFVPKKEGKFRDVATVGDLINPRSNVLILHDNNLTADPYCIDKLNEIRDRHLVVDINQGIDIRLMNEDIAYALSKVNQLRSTHYAWDLMAFESQVLDGVRLMSKYIKPYKHMCFMLVGFNTSFEEDMYRFRVLIDLGVSPYVMIYNQIGDVRLHHFARWVNMRIYKSCPDFEEYLPWKKARLGEVC